jgi:hypothetical protein
VGIVGSGAVRDTTARALHALCVTSTRASRATEKKTRSMTPEELKAIRERNEGRKAHSLTCNWGDGCRDNDPDDANADVTSLLAEIERLLAIDAQHIEAVKEVRECSRSR